MPSAAIARVLLIEDEPGLVLTLTDRLHREGYDVGVAQDGPTGISAGTGSAWDLVLLDVMLPGASGFDVLKELRRHGVAAPVIMLTARGEVVDKVRGLKLGADDYLVKPFEMIELLARMEAHLRRTAPGDPSAAEYRFADLVIEARSAEVRKAGRLLDLSAREFLLLKYFVEHRGAVLSRDELLNEVWGYRSMPSTRTVDVHVAWLRQKIEANPRHPQHLITVHKLGYKFVG